MGVIYKHNIPFGGVIPASLSIQVDTMPAPNVVSFGKVYQYIGETTGDFTHNYFYECILESSVYRWVNVTVQQSAGGSTIQFDVLPTASADLLGAVYQYTGATDSTYTHNYFYECYSPSVGNYAWRNVNVQAGSTIQYTTMPTASADLLGEVYQYIGTTDSTYTHGFYYECYSPSAGNYAWKNINVQEGTTIQYDTLPTASVDLLGEVYQYTGTTNANYTHNYFYECYSPSAGNYAWRNIKVQDGTTMQFDTLPAASADLLGEIYQFTGTTNSNYTNGFFYKCSEVTTGNYSWVNVQVQNGTVSRELTQLQYDALPVSEKSDGTVYYITDGILDSDRVAACGFTPIGTVISVMSNHAPANYLICDGSIYNIATYPELAEFIRQEFGSVNFFGGDGTTTFAVPDLQGEFLRGTGTNSNTNQGSGANVGVHQDATELPGFRINLAQHNVAYAYAKSTDTCPTNIDSSIAESTSRVNLNGTSDNYTEVSSLYTTRPTNTSVLYCIAYRNIYVDVKHSYTANERAVGTWVDGSILYQKTFTIASLTTDLLFNHDISNLGKVVKVDGIGYWTAESAWEQFNNINPYVYVNATTIEIGADYAMTDVQITVQYTKLGGS